MNSPILQRLNGDHKTIAQVLYCLRAEVRSYNDVDAQPSIGHIMDILDYITTVPERWHHPVEDVVFRKLMDKNPPHPGQIRTVLNEHEDLERLTKELKEAFERVSLDIAVPMEHLIKTANIYLSRQLLHLDAEESVLFPMAEEYLEDEDWDEIQQEVEAMLANQDVALVSEYEHLKDTILSFNESMAE